MDVYAWAFDEGGAYPQHDNAFRGGEEYQAGDLVTGKGNAIFTDDREEAEAYRPRGTHIVELESLPHPSVTLKEWAARHVLGLVGGACLDHLPMEFGIRGCFKWVAEPDGVPLSEFGTEAPHVAAERVVHSEQSTRKETA